MTGDDRQGKKPGRKVVLLGERGTKRTMYLEQAARQIGLPVFFIQWAHFGELWKEGFRDAVIKIDPPVWDSCDLEELEGLVDGYKEKLEMLADLQERQGVCFLDHPLAIRDLLEKSACKERLAQAGLPVTEQVAVTGVAATDQLLGQMAAKGIGQVFIKPQYGSGAAGTAAFRWEPRTGRMMLYTCALLDIGPWPDPDAPSGRGVPSDRGVPTGRGVPSDRGVPTGRGVPSGRGDPTGFRTLPRLGIQGDPEARLLNTKRLRCFSKKEEIRPLLDRLLKTGCIVERWYAKASYGDFSYDLRAVVQGGELDFLLARLSKGPITNLHLNNHPLEVSALGLPDEVLAQIGELCRRAMACYPGLWSAGIDILLERGSLKPRIIEMNGQGDLLYQDIYGENQIYRRQAEWMKAQAGG